MEKGLSGRKWNDAAPALITVCAIIAALEIGIITIALTAPTTFDLSALSECLKLVLIICFSLSIACFLYSSEKITDALEDDDQTLYKSTFLYYNLGIILLIV